MVILGGYFLYAAWAHPPLQGGTLCGTSEGHGVHFTSDLALKYYNHCGGTYENFQLYLLGFTLVGVILIGGGTRTIHKTIR